MQQEQKPNLPPEKSSLPVQERGKPGEKRKERPEAPVCDGCIKWNWHGKGCWVYWEKKKICSHFEDDYGSNKDGFRLAKEIEEFLL